MYLRFCYRHGKIPSLTSQTILTHQTTGFKCPIMSMHNFELQRAALQPYGCMFLPSSKEQSREFPAHTDTPNANPTGGTVALCWCLLVSVCWMLPHMFGILILAAQTPETEMDTELLEAVLPLVCTTARDSSSPHQEM